MNTDQVANLSAWQAKTAAVIPCLNESRTIAELAKELLPLVRAVLVVDDGSTDDTAAIAQAAGAEVLRQNENRGKGEALRLGLETARQRGFEWAATLDGDGQHAPADLPRFFYHAESSGADLIIGNRMAEAQSMPLARRWANQWASRQLGRMTGLAMPDSQCGYRLIRLAAWREVTLTTPGFELESEALLMFARAGKKLGFVPIPCRSAARPSRFRAGRDGWLWLKWWWRNR